MKRHGLFAGCQQRTTCRDASLSERLSSFDRRYFVGNCHSCERHPHTSCRVTVLFLSVVIVNGLKVYIHSFCLFNFQTHRVILLRRTNQFQRLVSSRRSSMSHSEKKIFAGIEGGATVSTAVLVDEHGNILSWVSGGSTNYLLLGIDKCHEAINDLIEQAFKEAAITDQIKLECLAMGLSGCEDSAANAKFSHALLDKFPQLAKAALAVSDSVCPIYTACPDGGITLISGTGSNSLLINPDSSEGRCGGWGHLLGDEGAAYWLSQRAVKYCIDEMDNLKKSPHPIDKVLKKIYSYFGVDNLFGLLPYAYTNFKKPHFAGLCAEIAKLADEQDPLARSLFFDAGKYLAMHIVALLPKVDPALMNSPGGLHIVCVGSVFKSWNHMKDGFLSVLIGKIKEVTLVRLKVSSALGCAFLAAKKIGVHLPITFEKNYEVFCHLKIDQ